MNSFVNRVIKDLKKKDFNSAYESQSIIVQTLTKTFQNLKDDNWLFPVINTVCLDLRTLATRLMTQPGSGTKPLEKAAECLMACFRICTADKSVLNPSGYNLKKYLLCSTICLLNKTSNNPKFAFWHFIFSICVFLLGV